MILNETNQPEVNDAVLQEFDQLVTQQFVRYCENDADWAVRDNLENVIAKARQVLFGAINLDLFLRGDPCIYVCEDGFLDVYPEGSDDCLPFVGKLSSFLSILQNYPAESENDS